MKQTKLRDTLAKWQTELSDSDSVRRPSIERFPPLNTEKIAKDLNLEERGTERGKDNLPAKDDETFDVVEEEILQVVRDEIHKSRVRFETNQSTYEDRYYRLYNLREYGTFETEARNSLSEFKKDVDDGLNQLQIVSEQLKETADERRSFKAKNKLDRTAHYPDGGVTVLRWGLIALLFLIESFANANFLAKGSDYGLIGGWVEAIAISFLNIGFALIIGLSVIREMWHRNFFRKLWGLFGLCLWVAFTVVFNLLVAHYREAAGIITEISGFVFSEFVADPFGIDEFQSWMLFGIGVLFAVITLLDALKMDDLYPFYGKLTRKYERLRIQYKNLRSDLIDLNTETRTNLTDLLSSATEETDKHSSERKVILINCNDEQRAFKNFLEKCNQDCNHLLNTYRAANTASRSDPAPSYFAESFEVGDISYSEFPVDLADTMEEVARFKGNLQAVIKDFFDAFDDTTYPQLSDITINSNGEKAA